jgi:hydrogenase small subunit
LPASNFPASAEEGIVKEVDILWITAGLSCDGDSVSVTAATMPSVEDLLMGGLPGLPKVRLHNPVLAYDVGDQFLEAFHRAAAGKLDPFVLVIEGSIPNEKIKAEGYWAAMGNDPVTGQPIPTCDCPTISAGSGARRRACRWCACPAVRCSPTTSPRPSSICSISSPGWRR